MFGLHAYVLLAVAAYRKPGMNYAASSGPLLCSGVTVPRHTHSQTAMQGHT